jgi:hypothetical protein
MYKHEIGLVNQYIGVIASLGVVAMKGEDVTEKVKAAVKEHCEHFRILKSSQPQENLIAYRVALKMRSDLAHDSQPQVKATYEYALSVCPIEL